MSKNAEEIAAVTEIADESLFIHLSRDTAAWVEKELSDQWEYMAADSLHHTFHLSRALLELRMQLGMEID